MGAINYDTNPDLHLKITEGNLQRQFDLLRDLVSVGTRVPFGVTAHIVMALHGHATVHLVENPGRYRLTDVHIQHSSHIPPEPHSVVDLMGQYFVELRNKWNSEPEFILAAYALWRLCWIHPFEDGNGRTARAVAYLIICLKKGQWLPGTDTVLHKIKLHKESYSAALRHADASHSAGIADVIPLAVLLAQHTAEQLR